VIGFDFKKFDDQTQRVAEAAARGTLRALQKAAFAIFRSAQESIERDAKPAAAGEPPHSRAGQLPRAIRYDVDKAAEAAVIGPRASLVGTSAEAHEFGGAYKGAEYPARPFMVPALQRNLDLIPAGFADQVTTT
jgi:phage gpG-like protein